MPSSITANLASPYLSRYQIFNNNYNNQGIVNFTFTGNVANISGHPFLTGDKLYLRTSSNTSVNHTFYAIKVSNNELAFATTYSNAIGNIQSNFASTNSGTVAISNAPMLFRINFSFPTYLLTENMWIATSKSAQTFAVTDSVQIDFSTPTLNSFQDYFANLYWVFGLSSDTGGYNAFCFEAGSSCVGDSITGIGISQVRTNWTNTWRILIQTIAGERKIIIQNRQTNTTYLSVFTSSGSLSLNITNLRLFANFSLNGQALSNCQITYL